MMWADKCWLFCDHKEGLVAMVDDIIEELLDLDMEPKPESLWFMSTHQVEYTSTLKVVYRGLAWDLPKKTCLKSWNTVYIAMGWCLRVQNPCERNVGEYSATSESTALEGCVNWPWRVTMLAKMCAWVAQILRLTFRPQMYAGES